MDKEWEDFYKYAESNIVGYKRPADFEERVQRILERKANPAHTNINYDHKRGYDEDN